MQRVRSHDGTDIAVHRLGGDGPTLLLVHATGFHGHVWLPVVDRLRATFTCIAVDQRAHGDSGVPASDAGYGWRNLGLDVLAVLDALGLDRVAGAGHSSGGAALFLAEQERPGTFRSLWCYEPIVVPVDDPPPPMPDNPMSEGARRRREVFASRDDALANYASKPPFSALAPEALRAYVDYGFDDLPDGTVRLRCRGANEAMFYASQGGHTAYRELAKVVCPVTVVRGAEQSAPAGFVDAVLARLPDARLEVLAGAGHFGPLEDPPGVAASIQRSLTR